MQKKSQVIAFILIGLVVLVIAVALAYLMSDRVGEEQVPTSMEPVNRYIKECLQETAEGAILLAGVQGGVIYLGDVIPNEETFYSYSTYWYEEGLDTSVSKTFIEKEIAAYVTEEIDSRCLKGLEAFNMNLETGDISTMVDIQDNYVDISMDYPVTLVEGDTITMISQFDANIPVKLGKAIGIANDIVELEKADPDYIHLSEIGEMDMMVVPYKHSDNVVIYSIVDENAILKDLEFKLIFANKFGAESSGNRDPVISNADNLLVVEGLETEYQFEAVDLDEDSLVFDSIGRFRVSEDGMMKFTPGPDDVGEHVLTVIVEDGNGGRDSEIINILVLEA